jgi:hypothetical protein
MEVRVKIVATYVAKTAQNFYTRSDAIAALAMTRGETRRRMMRRRRRRKLRTMEDDEEEG